MPSRSRPIGSAAGKFPGFEHLSANYIYCPNQFFEVCLRHYSRGVVRLVGYMLRKTLGYLDKNGQPFRQDIRIPYLDLSEYAGVSTRAIPKAIRDAESGRFIVCVSPGVANRQGHRGQAAEYRLRWSSEESSYTDDLKKFDGFYCGDGYRTPIPNGFFDIVACQETLAMTKVVGTILRHTVGYQNQFGGRRSEAPLSYGYIQKFANMKDRTTLSETLKEAVNKGYIQCAAEGRFDPQAGRNSCAAKYAVKWLDQAENRPNTVKTRPEDTEDGKKPTGNTAKCLPEEDGKIPTGRKTVSKHTHKQQTVVAKNPEGYELLVGEGIHRSTAALLSASATLEEIQNQIEWLPFRNPDNRPAMLRKAIEEKWAIPDGAAEFSRQENARERERQEQFVRNERGESAARQKQQREKRRQSLLVPWRALSASERENVLQRRIMQATSDGHRRRLRNIDMDNPPLDVLLLLENEAPF